MRLAASVLTTAAGATTVPSFVAEAPSLLNSALLQPCTRSRRCQRMPAGKSPFCSGITVAPPPWPGSSMYTVKTTWSKPCGGLHKVLMCAMDRSSRSAPPEVDTLVRRRSIWRVANDRSVG